jgi:DtxR family Mn-dependent transcriptional regulator
LTNKQDEAHDLGMSNLKPSQISKSIEDYLKIIWLAGQNGPVATSTIAAALRVSDASVSGMLAKLSELRLVSYTRYHGAQLTLDGKIQALKLLRRHRLIETFLIDYLGYGWDEVHGEAEALEHTISDRFTELLAARLGHPTHDPHGDPIPRADGTLPTTPDVPLAELAAGQALEVARLRTQEADVLAYLANLSVQPGQVLRVHEVEPLGGLLRVSADGLEFSLSKTLATLVRGRPL